MAGAERQGRMDCFASLAMTLMIRRNTVTPCQTHPIRVGSNASEGPEQPIPEEIDDGEIGVRMPVMEEMQLLLSSEPAESPQPAAGDVILRVEIDMGVER